MMTVITETTLKPGQEQEWDRAFEERIGAAKGQPGWVDAQLLIPEDEPNKRIVVGTWRSRDDWERWHQTSTFQQTREPMNRSTADDGRPEWHQVRAREAMEA